MDSADFEARMRRLEYFHGLRTLPGAWVALRVDGRGFTRLTASRFEKPFDPAFHALMLGTAQALLEELQGLYAYTESDEISVLFPPGWQLFDREVEKLVSISASVASAAFTLASQSAVHFDSRIWMGAERQQVVDYFRWRQADAERCGLNGWCHWMLVKDGKSAVEANAILAGKSVGFKNELLFQHGVNFNDLPVWQRRGTGIYWERQPKAGFNPKEGRAVVTTRRRPRVDEELPMKDAYAAFIQGLLDTVPLDQEAQ